MPKSDPGMELARKVYDRPKGKDVSSVVKMVLTGKGSTQRERELVLFSVDKGGSERWSLMRFSLPTDVEGTGLLTMDHPGDASEQWLYLPALDRVRRISSSRKGGRFVGSDFFYEDLRDREPDMDTHTIAGGEKVGGLDCSEAGQRARECVQLGLLAAYRLDPSRHAAAAAHRFLPEGSRGAGEAARWPAS